MPFLITAVIWLLVTVISHEYGCSHNMADHISNLWLRNVTLKYVAAAIIFVGHVIVT